MPTIAHISDLHLQSGVPERQAQVEPILQKINAMKPDLVVISGDVTDDGWDSVEELKWAKDWLDQRIDGEWFAVPGNHDVGNFVSQEDGQINEARVDAWEKTFGWNNACSLFFGEEDKPGVWRIFGFNSMLFGSDARQEKLERDWLAEQQDINSCWDEGFVVHQMVFIHSPCFVDEPSEPGKRETDYWLGPKAPREKFFARLRDLDIKLLGSGHVHQTRLTEVDGVKIAWAPPASGTWVHAPGLPNPPMPERTGFFLHHLHDDGTVESELVECAPMLKLYEHNPWP